MIKYNKIPLEKTIEKSILKFLNEEAPKIYDAHCRAVKWSQNGRQRGNPDIICSIDGFLFLFEVKRPEVGKITELQAATMELWRKSGAKGYFVESVECVKEILDKNAEMWYNRNTHQSKEVRK